MDSNSKTESAQLVNGNNAEWKQSKLNPEAKEFTPRSFLVNGSKTEKAAAATDATMPTAAATDAIMPTAVATTTTTPIPQPHYYPYRPQIVPVVYPSQNGTPGTVFYMPVNEVPLSAVLLPMPYGEANSMAFYYKIERY